ncbi:MAG: hypothetical protein H6835_04580 [Planctomycetes bacterium]|nr:hypothetical protein [Planctomycetota bacterium]
MSAVALAQNDNCAGAIPVFAGDNGPFSNVGSTTSAPAWPCGNSANDVWFKLDTTVAGSVTVDTCGAAIDTVLQVFSGSCGNLVSLGCNDDTCNTGSSVTVQVQGLSTYLVRVAGYGGVTGSFPVRVQGPVVGTAYASQAITGQGCIRNPASFYESLSLAAIDLDNSSMTLIPSGGGYFVTQSNPVFLPPSAAAIVLPLGDDTGVAVPLSAPMSYPGGSTSTLHVNSNGVVSMAAGNNTAPLGPITLLDQPATAYFVQSDFDPSLLFGGRVKFEQVGAKACVTWDGVWAFGGGSSTASTFQLQFDTSTGNVHYVFLGLETIWGLIVGYSPGGASYDGGAIDISARLATSFQLPAVDGLPLTVTPASRPIIGTAWTMDVTNFPPASTLGVDIIGLVDPGIDDLASIGMPGCGLRSSLEVVSPWTPFGVLHSYAIGLPANPALIGIQLHTTSAVFVPGVNAFGAITGNGVTGLLGDY